MADFKFLLDVIAKFEFSVKLIIITCKYNLHVILCKYHMRFGILIWQDNGDATPAKFEFSLKLITITFNFQLHQRQSEVGNNHIQIQTACDSSQVSRAFLRKTDSLLYFSLLRPLKIKIFAFPGSFECKESVSYCNNNCNSVNSSRY